MEDKLYEKIGRQEVMIEALKRQNGDLSQLLAKFLSGDEKPSDWAVNQKGQLVKKSPAPAPSPKKK